MIYAYTGTPGSGKSLDALRKIRSFAEVGRTVVCNFEVGKVPFARRNWCPVELDNDELLQYVSSLPRVSRESCRLLVIDECQLIFNPRDWNSPDRRAWLSFFTQHRKFGFDVILITQDLGMMDKQIRALVEYEVMHRKLSSFGFVSKIISLCFLNRLFGGVVYWGPRHMRVNSFFFLRLPWMSRAYDSFKDWS